VTGKRAEEVFSSLDENAQKGFTTLFWNLVQVDESGNPTRQRAPKNKIYQDQAVARLSDVLINARLLIADQDREGHEVIEIAHEALLNNWKRLANWLDEVQGDLKLLEKVRIMATEWEEKGRNPAFLWPDERLKEVESVLTRLPTAIRESKVSPLMWEFIRPEMERLLEELQRTPNASHIRRVEIGNRMDVIGDDRPGVGLVLSAESLKHETDNGLPDIEWCDVPGGSVTLEDAGGLFAVKACFIAKYTVTYTQFQAFIDDPRGYKDNQWWEGLSRRATEPRNQRHKGSNQPRENVWWSEAVAFCRWLAAKYALQPSRLPQAMAGWSIRLPTEWEWQQAATGGEPQRKYPWSSSYDNIPRANTQESGLGRTTAVGMYPDGASATGVSDLCGNVWEWCLNEHGSPANIGFVGTSPRARRGGSFEQQTYRVAFRSGFDPYFRYDTYIGFRVLYGPILHPG
jgi:formylglycine-generating enzyme required for sulfatase activity